MTEAKSNMGINDRVSLLFKKKLDGSTSEIYYENVMPGFHSQMNAGFSTITLQIDGLKLKRPNKNTNDAKNNAFKALSKRPVKLVIYHGYAEWTGKSATSSLSLTDSVFIVWRVDSIEYLTSISSSLKTYNSLSIYMVLDEGDAFFEQPQKIYNANLQSITATFE